MSHKTLDNLGLMAYNLMPSKNQTAKPPEHESSTAADRIYNLSRTDEPENTPRTSTHTRNRDRKQSSRSGRRRTACPQR